ncbi:glycoside hydrolase family 5 protein [Trichoderma citrinoviride]|uniref:glucan 1,3-beta-glucosidase n=1 Tax=Trichoderma citrinoviride TaxID=58853 RepID=A0A2T4BI09_9HYPO|nr:glycoside hydrolase family 5 protein [Trichoderma citrinoviride]PTB68940.1 glycoside hydrolase family 5 protein [Trichoderma citrinoviride]
MSDTDIPRAHRHRSARGESSRRDRERTRDRERDRERTRDRDRERDGERDRSRKHESRTRRGASSADEGRADRRSRSQSQSLRRERERTAGHEERERERAERHQRRERERERRREQERERERERERHPGPERVRPSKQKKSRVVSGAAMEEGRTRGWGFGFGHAREDSYDSLRKEELYSQPEKKKTKWSKRKKWIVGGICGLILLIIIIVAAVVGSKKKSGGSNDSPSSSASNSKVPTQYIGTYLDPSTWASTTDFNTTFTNETVGGLSVMGLYSDWDDSAQANDNVPPLNKPWGNYSKTPARGVNLGGWLSIEPFITPSLFNYPLSAGIVDEWTLCAHLGAKAAETIENHYNTFVDESTFKDIADAGLDHVRIPFSYWAVKTYDGDQYVAHTSWRYLLRGIEWARKYGLRVNLDLHGLPGSQNGWNHSGRQGQINWLNGTDGDLNAQRSLDIHNSLSQFFSQKRYQNIITHYGLANEPKMVYLDHARVINWTETAFNLVRKNGYKGLVIFGDGFMGLNNWQGLMQGYDGLVLDVHQYVIFNVNQIDFTHQKKVEYACAGWTQQAEQSQDPSTGYGPTQFAEWSQADTDCAQYVTNVGQGSRWEGTLSGNASTAVLSPGCPTKNSQCSCAQANADPSKWSDEYKKFLSMFAEAQMYSFEKGLGWWYWTWKTESSPQWSYQAGMQAGVLPKKAYDRDFNCDVAVPDFSKEGLPEYY